MAGIVSPSRPTLGPELPVGHAGRRRATQGYFNSSVNISTPRHHTQATDGRGRSPPGWHARAEQSSMPSSAKACFIGEGKQGKDFLKAQVQFYNPGAIGPHPDPLPDCYSPLNPLPPPAPSGAPSRPRTPTSPQKR